METDCDGLRGRNQTFMHVLFSLMLVFKGLNNFVASYGKRVSNSSIIGSYLNPDKSTLHTPYLLKIRFNIITILLNTSRTCKMSTFNSNIMTRRFCVCYSNQMPLFRKLQVSNSYKISCSYYSVTQRILLFFSEQGGNGIFISTRMKKFILRKNALPIFISKNTYVKSHLHFKNYNRHENKWKQNQRGQTKS